MSEFAEVANGRHPLSAVHVDLVGPGYFVGNTTSAHRPERQPPGRVHSQCDILSCPSLARHANREANSNSDACRSEVVSLRAHYEDPRASHPDQRSKGELRSRNSSRQASLKSRSGSISPLSLICRSSGNVLLGSK